MQISQLVEAHQIGSRSWSITLYVSDRPASGLQEYFSRIANEYAYAHHAKVHGVLDIDLHPFRDNGHLTFTMKTWKNPNKHRNMLKHASECGRVHLVR